MFSPELKRLADEYSLWYRDDVVYGTVKGCYISISRILDFDTARWRFCIYIGCPQQGDPSFLLGKAEAAAAVVRWEATDSLYGIAEPRLNLEHSNLHILENGSILQVNMLDHPDHGSLRQLRAFIENILPKIAPHTSPDICAKCGGFINTDDRLSVLTGRKRPDSLAPAFLPGGAVVPMHASCAKTVSNTSQKSVQENQERLRRNMRMAILSAIFCFLFYRFMSWLFRL